MSTTFTVQRVGRALTNDMFTDLGYPVIEFTPLWPTGYQIDLTEDLTVSQIQRAKIRIGTRDATQEAFFVAVVNAIPDLDTIIGTTGALSTANLSLAVRALAADMKGLAIWLGKDVI